ncbi:PQQ-dependent sugar dehydrogenase [Maribacter sp. Asnod2-G09]|uniref:PQQ-dependent sugar dehydrogenase n=1 Tax=Maribacter sp. Asnod2-G09 TaxID=3160577 RepID=UPI00386AA527
MTSFSPMLFGPGISDVEPIGKFLNGNFQGLASNDQPYVPAYPNLRFDSPLNFTTVPNQLRIVVGQRDGKVYWFDDNEDATVKNLLINLSNEVGVVWDGGFLGLSIHPSFGTSGKNFFYIYYSTKSPDTTLNSPLGFSCGIERFHGNYLVLERFEVNPINLSYVSGSRFTMLKRRMYNTSHRGGGMEFGDDQFLYLSTGDQAAYINAQSISENLDGGVLRIDVDMVGGSLSHAPIRTMSSSGAGEEDEVSGKGYFIPNDNPFNNSNGSVFEEYYSLGHRNPHRLTKDRATGTFYIGEVGENTHEEINVLAAGKNYGWPLYEGKDIFLNSCISELYNNMLHQGPLTEFPRSDANSIIGGYVYRGTEIPELEGKYICADYGIGDEIWAVNTSTGQYELLGNFGPENIISFGQDYQGELYLLKYGSNVNLYKLAATGISNINAPQLLSQTGAFSNLQSLTVNSGIIPYDMIDSFWSDGANKKRWMAIPNDGTHNTLEEQIVFSENGVWDFPTGAVLIKHFDYPIDDTNPNATKKMETRFSVKGDDGKFYFFTYNWNNSQTDAVLQEIGLDETIQVATVDGGIRQETWHFPSNSECISCHNVTSKGTLGPRTRYLNRDYDYANHSSGGVVANQLVTLSHLGILNETITDADAPSFLTHTSIDDVNGSIEDKARSYLDLNCAYCHQPATANRANFDLRLFNSLSQTGLLTAGMNETLNGLPSNQRIVYPGDASKSQLFHRTASTNMSIMMPPLAKEQSDLKGVALIETWINQMEVPVNTPQLNNYQIVNRNSGLTLQVSDAELINQSNIMVGWYQDLPNQQFELELVDNGYFQFKNLNSGLYLDVAWASIAPNTNVWQYTGNSSDAQLWELRSTGDGAFHIVSKLSGHYLGVQPNNNVAVLPDSGDNIVEWEFVSLDAQTTLTVSSISNRISVEGEESAYTVNTHGGDPLQPISFSATGLPAGISISGTTGVVSGILSTGTALGGPAADGLYAVGITVTRGTESAVEDFEWQVTTGIVVPPLDSDVVFRIKSAGPTVPSTDGGPDWLGGAPSGAHSGTGYSVNTGVSAPATGMLYVDRDPSIPSYIDQTTYGSLFSHERWDGPGAPEMQYSVPLPNGDYRVNIYVGNFCSCTDEVGERVFGITVEGNVVRNGLDLITEFGHRSGGMLSYPVTVSDGSLQIGFLHGTENPIVNAIEIMGTTGPHIHDALTVSSISNRISVEGEESTFTVNTQGGDPLQPISFSATGLPAGISISGTTGVVSGILSTGTALGGPAADGLYAVGITVTRGTESAVEDFEWQVTTGIVVPPLDSDVVFRIKSAGPTVPSTDGGPDWLGGAPSGAHSGTGYSVNTGVSAPATGMLYVDRDPSIPSYIDQTTYGSLFSHERWDGPGAPEMQYSVPLPNGDYRVNIYVGNFCSCTDEVGERVFGITVEGNVVRNGLDLITEFGHRSGGMLSYPVTVSDGSLQLGFLHGTENPIVNAIEIISVKNSGLQLKTKIIDDTSEIKDILIYPNPVNSGETLFINLKSALNDKPIVLELYNIFGSKIKQREYQVTNTNVLEFVIDNNIAIGVYIINVRVGDSIVKTQKIIIK